MSNAASSAVDSSQGGGGNEQEVVRIFQSKMDQRRMLVQKIGELEAQYSEHARVYEMLVPMEGTRRAFQLVNGVLVEGTVEEMRPMVEGNREGLKDVLVNEINGYLLEKILISLGVKSKYICLLLLIL